MPIDTRKIVGMHVMFICFIIILENFADSRTSRNNYEVDVYSNLEKTADSEDYMIKIGRVGRQLLAADTEASTDITAGNLFLNI